MRIGTQEPVRPSLKWPEAARSIKEARAVAPDGAPRVSVGAQVFGGACVAAEAVAGGVLASGALAQVSSPTQAALAGATFAVGYLGADALNGALHAFLDQARPSAFPRLKEALLASQRHHLTPSDVTRAGPFDYMAPFAMAFTPLLAGLAYADPSYWVSSGTVGFALGLTIVLDVHRYTHVPESKMPRILKVTSWLGLTQRRDKHWAHHGEDDKNLCELTDYVNPVFDRLRVYERIGNTLKRFGLHTEQPDTSTR